MKPLFLAAIVIAFFARTAVAASYTSVTTFAVDPKLDQPAGITALTSGDLIVADRKEHSILRITAAGAVSVIAGTGKKGNKNGAANVAEFNGPSAVVYDAQRQLIYVADTDNDRIRVVASNGFVSTLEVNDGNRFMKPSGLALAANGDLYVADSGNHVVRRVTPDGVLTTVAGNGQSEFRNGAAMAAGFKQPVGLAVAANGALYIADAGDHRIRKLEGGTITTVAGSGVSGFADGPALSAKFKRPAGIAFDGEGNLLVAETDNQRIRVITAATVSTIAGNGTQGRVDGNPATAEFKDPIGIAVRGGTIFVADTKNNAIRAIHPAAMPGVTITSVTPTGAASAGADVRIFGSGFFYGQTTVQFGTTAATSVTFISTSEIVAKVPAGLASAKYSITVATPTSSATLPDAFTLDADAPSITATAAPTPNAAGWNRASVRVTFTCTDALSGIASCPVPVDVVADSAAHVVSGTAVDQVGNSSTASIPIKLDQTAPTITSTITPEPNPTGWNNEPITVSFQGIDALSGIAGVTEAVTVSNEGVRDVTGSATDVAGNTASTHAAVKVDLTPPAITISFPFADIATIYGAEVDLFGTITDGLSGVQQVSCGGTIVALEGDVFRCRVPLAVGSNQLDVRATDAAGNIATMSRTLSYVLDTIAPTIHAVYSSPANAAGWHGEGVGVDFVCEDNEPQSAVCGSPNYLFTDGAGQQVDGSAVDAAGNTTNLTVTVNVDTTPPLLTLDALPETIVTNGAQYALHGNVSEALSGMDRVQCNGAAVSWAGTAFDCSVALTEEWQTVRVQAWDRADNESVISMHVLRDSTAPVLEMIDPVTPVTTNDDEVFVTFEANDDDRIASITVGGQNIDPSDDPISRTVTLTDGTNLIAIVVTDRAGNVATHNVDVRRVARVDLDITSPTEYAVLQPTSIDVSGSISGSVAALDVNGIPAQISGNTFSAAGVPLAQGRTVITATVRTATGHLVADSVNVYRDSIPPRVTVVSPAENSIVASAAVTVSGTVDDIVIGTINAGQMSVSVNGIPAIVRNRTFVAESISLAAGPNTLSIVATDQGGNITGVAHAVTRSTDTTRLEIVSGDGQSAIIGAPLPQPLRVRAVDAAGAALPSTSVTFTIEHNNGLLLTPETTDRSVTVLTDAQGEATVNWKLGYRAGAGNNRVAVSAAGIPNPLALHATARNGAPAMIVVDMGDNQFGVSNELLPRPLVIAVVDAGSNRLANIPVRFSVLEGGGSIDSQESVIVQTDSDGRAWITPRLGTGSGMANNTFVAGIDGLAGNATFFATGRVAGPVEETRITGVVLDNSNLPISGVTLRIADTVRTAVTDVQGQFIFHNAPIGYVKLLVDGSTAQRPGTWPTLEFALYTNAGQDNTAGMPIYLLPIDVTRGIQVDEMRGGTLTLPELPGFSLTVAPGSALFPTGTRVGTISATLVHADKMPMVPGFGQQPRFIVTIQPPGVHFDPPAAITMPNVDGLGPGEVTELYSFDHDLGQFVAIGTGSVTADGTTLRSDPGVGIIKGGWHCGGNPAPTGSTGCTKVRLDVELPAQASTLPADPYDVATSIATEENVATRPVSESIAAIRRVNANAMIAGPDVMVVGTCAQLVATRLAPGSTSGTFNPWTISDPLKVRFITAPPACTGATCTADVKALRAGTVTVSITYTSNGQSVSDSKVIQVVDLKVDLDELRFDGDIEITRDDVVGGVASLSEIPSNESEWKKANAADPSKNQPVAYARSGSILKNKIKLEAIFKIDPPLTEDLENVVVEGTIVLPGVGVPALVSKKNVKIKKGEATLKVNDFEVSFTLPKTTLFYNPMTITWKIKPTSTCSYEVAAGISDNRVYVLWGSPLPGTKVYYSSLHLGTKNAPADSAKKVVEQAWQSFGTGTSPGHVKGWNGTREFRYYPANSEFGNNAGDLETLLMRADGNSKCGGFGPFLQNVLAIHGIVSHVIKVEPANKATGKGMLVKNWQFLTGTVPDPVYKWFFRTWHPFVNNEMTDPGNVNPSVDKTIYGEIQSMSGVAGQNSI
ncbi:MAG TPA: IPT/TIG domain-containing protein, partial [Thermoanaerobaculia bacterium]|nr:IPT/TIG domain-containing protein [Thermoanaerobaculia bacterium]